MTWTEIEKLVVMWWNTGLTPPVAGLKDKVEKNIEYVSEYIKNNYNDRKFQILGLCEVDEDDVKEIVSKLNNPDIKYYFPPQINKRVKIDIAVIYDERYLILCDKNTWIDTYGRFETIKTGVAVSFIVPLIDKVLNVVLSHWPSQQTYPEDSPHRGEIATSCRKSIDAIRKNQEQHDTYILLMGDYNAEPFSNPMAKNLLATRDRKLAREDYGMLYNPFWRLMGEFTSHLPDSDIDFGGGTCFSSGDRYRRWASFDQIIFSSPFLKSSEMIFDESETRVVVDEVILEKIKEKSFIDHFPVSSTIILRKFI